MIEKTLIGELIKAERKRLQLTLDQLGDIANTSKRTVINWEKGSTYPDAVQLMHMNCQGFNTNLIITGESTIEKLSDDERSFLGFYRRASPLIKKVCLNVLDTEPITVTEQLHVEDDEHFCEDVDRLKVTAVTQVYQNSEGREVNRVRVPIPEYKARNQDKHPLLESFEQLNEANQARLLEMVQNAVYRQQRDAMVRDSFEGLSDKPALTPVKKPRL